MLAKLELAGIKGPGIWILFKDRCGRNPTNLMKLLADSTVEQLQEMAVDR